MSGYSDEQIARAGEYDRWRLNARRMALLAEAFVHEPHRITAGGLMAQVHRVLTGEDVQWTGGGESPSAAGDGDSRDGD